eukprot:gb/GECG01010203.1/.p1 GENE.gb/GECG01010203.1/~~gb/GECG01010203.1/.p1  ORF type:complete len:240 (+),score=41.08 gb/GECG01010203.1/:1-720(+)
MTKEMYKNNTVIIAAGYRESMYEMLKCNNGPKSRFTKEVAFADWSAEDCRDHFVTRAYQDGLTVENEALSLLEECYVIARHGRMLVTQRQPTTTRFYRNDLCEPTLKVKILLSLSIKQAPAAGVSRPEALETHVADEQGELRSGEVAENRSRPPPPPENERSRGFETQKGGETELSKLKRKCEYEKQDEQRLRELRNIEKRVRQEQKELSRQEEELQELDRQHEAAKAEAERQRLTESW